MPTPTNAQQSAILLMGITPATKVVLLDILRAADQLGVALISPIEVAARTALTSRGVYKALDALVTAGLATDLSGDTVVRATHRKWQVNMAAVTA
jgi:hypothetical protein